MPEQDLKKLASELSQTYSSYLTAPNLENLSQLNQYNSHLPLSWFTPQLLDALQTHYTTGDSNVQPPIFGLWSTWIRRLVVSGSDLSDVRLTFVLTQFEHVLSTGTDVDSIKYLVIALSCLAGLNNGIIDDMKLAELLSQALPVAVRLPKDKDLQDTVDASVSYFVANAISSDAILAVLLPYMDFLGDQLRRIFFLVENAADLRWQNKNNGKALGVLWEALQSIHNDTVRKIAPASAIAGLVYVTSCAYMLFEPQLTVRPSSNHFQPNAAIC
jgi:hypothetical protein